MKLSGRQSVLLQYVKDAHGDQKRKYTGEPYWKHPYAVAEIVSNRFYQGIEIALCHDLFEDTKVEMPDLLRFLMKSGYENKEALFIVDKVDDLTDVFTKENYPKLNRAERKKREAERLGKASYMAQTVKYADLIDNTKSIVKHDLNFAKVYLKEKRQLLDEMRRGDFTLLEMCEKQITEL